MKAIVTVKLPRNPKHNPRNKKTGICPLCDLGLHVVRMCTDKTGSHHSYIEEGMNVKDIETKAKNLFGHVTRIEVIM